MSKIAVLKTYKLHLFGLLVISVAIFSACSGLMNRQNLAPKTETPKAPPERVVVDGIRTSYADLVEKASPAVVRITAIVKKDSRQATSGSPLEDFFKEAPEQRENQLPTRGFGSGVIVSEDGTILTNHHVVADAEKITVQLENNETYEAKVVGSDPPSDLAVLKIEGEKFQYLKLGDSEKVLVGDIVLAIGNPLGIGQTVTSGIISAKGRRTGLGDGSFEDFLQTDAPINRGNSGGALINLSGELIGINSQILSPTGGSIGIGFSIPSNMAKSVMEQLIKTGKVRRGMLGINIQNITSEIAEQLKLKDTKGVLVSNVQADSAAEKAGVKRGDVIVSINDEAIEDGNILRNKVAGTQPDTEITLKIIREGKEITLKAKLGEFQASQSEPKLPGQNDAPSSAPNGDEENGKLGLSLQPLTPEIAKRLNIPAEVKGVLVTEVDPNSPAAEEGIRRGDVLIEINRTLVSSLADVRKALEKSGDGPALLLVSRGGQTVFISVKPAKK
ncbi:MAG: DegQ family serine endoprotease [Pyrinomonadaceae bacterium]